MYIRFLSFKYFLSLAPEDNLIHATTLTKFRRLRLKDEAVYSGKDNLQYAKENDITLVAKLNPIVSKGGRNANDGFKFNKDTGMMVCPAGEMVICKVKQGKKNENSNQFMTYYLDVENCKAWPHA